MLSIFLILYLILPGGQFACEDEGSWSHFRALLWGEKNPLLLPFESYLKSLSTNDLYHPPLRTATCPDKAILFLLLPLLPSFLPPS